MKSAEEYFKERVNIQFLCHNCKGLLLRANQSSCGCHRFCNLCPKYQKCETCQCEFTLISVKGIVRDLNKIKLKCSNDGCDVHFTYNDYFKHVTNCDFRIIECINCQENVSLKELKKHKSTTCESNEKKCTLCQKMVKFVNSKHIQFTETNAPECEDLYGDCPKCQNKNVQLKSHYKICQQKPCLLREYGCKGFVQFNECSNVSNHLDYITKETNKFNDSIENIYKRMANFEEYKEKINMKKILNDLENQIFSLQKIIDTNIELYKTPKKGKLIWRISNVDNILKDQMGSMISEPMRNDDYGYKLALKIYPQGDGIGKNNYFSIYYVIMKGGYDDLLAWPFSKRVKITLYNQKDTSKSKSETYKPDINSKSTSKPKDKINIASGNPTFISLKELNEDGYIIDNVMFIELNVKDERSFL